MKRKKKKQKNVKKVKLKKKLLLKEVGNRNKRHGTKQKRTHKTQNEQEEMRKGEAVVPTYQIVL